MPGDLEHDLPDGTGHDHYLDGVALLLPQALARSRPDLCFFLAGADRYAGDPLDTLRAAGVPVCLTLAGGNADPIEDTVAINVRTVELFSA